MHTHAIWATISDMTVTGRNGRKSLATRERIGLAALDLAVDRGYDAVTIESIADAAEVSARTFHNHFASKDQAVLFALDSVVRGLVTSFALRDPTEPVLDSLEAVLVELFESSAALERMVAVTRLMSDHPTLTARHHAASSTAGEEIVAEIARRTGTDPAFDLYPRLVYQVANGVARAAVDLHVDIGSDGPPMRRFLVSSVHEGFDQLRRALPQPPS